MDIAGDEESWLRIPAFLAGPLSWDLIRLNFPIGGIGSSKVNCLIHLRLVALFVEWEYSRVLEIEFGFG